MVFCDCSLDSDGRSSASAVAQAFERLSQLQQAQRRLCSTAAQAYFLALLGTVLEIPMQQLDAGQTADFGALSAFYYPLFPVTVSV